MQDKDSTTESTPAPRRTPRLPTWLFGVLLATLIAWYIWQFFGPTGSQDTNAPNYSSVTAGQMAALCTTPQLCGMNELTKYQYQQQGYQWGLTSSVNIEFVSFITVPTADGTCPTWRLPSPIQAKYTDGNGQPYHVIGGPGKTVTACDPVFYVDKNGVV